jgi:hypothetical protein
MRDVAPAVTGTQSAIKAAMSAAVNVLVITAPQCDGRLLVRIANGVPIEMRVATLCLY